MQHDAILDNQGKGLTATIESPPKRLYLVIQYPTCIIFYLL
jgi:hypothetical protein